jgi:hypothetical protein
VKKIFLRFRTASRRVCMDPEYSIQEKAAIFEISRVKESDITCRLLGSIVDIPSLNYYYLSSATVLTYGE